MSNEIITIENAHANNLKNITLNIEFGMVAVCARPSGSGKSSFAYETLVNKEKCSIKNYPSKVRAISQKIFDTSKKITELLKLKDEKNALIIIDEPLAGMTNDEAIQYANFIKKLSSNNNAVVIVEHRREIFNIADKVLVFGPNSGFNGGYLVDETTGQKYLKELSNITINRVENKSNRKISAEYSEFEHIKNYNVLLFLNQITSISGPQKSGKSTYLDAIYKALDKSTDASERRKNLISVKNKNYIRRPHIIDASPVSKNSRSTVATYFGISQFLKNENLDITVSEALNIYKDKPLLIRRIKHLEDIGLDYLKLNQSSYSLSGGECQRIKLAKLLCKKLGDRSVYIFDNPVRGLGEKNIEQVMLMFDKLVKNNNTVLIAENDPIALKFVDRIINL